MNVRMLALLIAVSCLTGDFTRSLAGTLPNQDQNQGQRTVEPTDKTPVFRVNVVSRSTKAVDYRHRGGSTKVDLRGTDLMPTASGEVRVESKTGRLEINAKLNGLEPANKFGLEYLTYVLWAVTPEGRANNLGEIVLSDGKSEIRVTTDLQAFGLIVTAEPYFAVTQPSDLVVAENVIRADTKGREEAINVKYALLPRGLYASQVEPLRDVLYGIDSKAPLDLFEARSAVRIARNAKAEQDLKQAEDYYRRKQGRRPIGTVAREAAQTAEEARVMSLKRQEEERIAKDKDAAAAREAQAKAEAESSKQEAELTAQRSAQQKQDADAAQATALAQQQALQAENLAYPDLRMEVDGHTDSTGSDEYNQQLSEKRAASVRDYLVQQGIPISGVAVMGFGKTEPVASNSTAAGRQQNRRVELMVSGEVIGTPIGSNSKQQNSPHDSTTVPAQPQR
jgi:outer membrane protein OmpA-like peptidoglycan-associated protein